MTIAPIACSRMPKGTLRPTCTAENSPAPSNTVFVDSTRSAAPPIIVGPKGANAPIVCCEAARVASFSPASKLGSAACQPSRSLPCQARSQSAASSGSASRHAPKRSDHCVWARSPACLSDMCSYTRSSTQKWRSGSKPITCLAAATSSSPSGAPWALAVSTAWGAGYAMCERIAMKEGRSASARAACRAAEIASTSSASSTRCTCQPLAAMRATWFSVSKLIDVVPSIVMWLSS